MIIPFRKYTLLPLDDCPYELQPNIPNLSRWSLRGGVADRIDIRVTGAA